MKNTIVGIGEALWDVLPEGKKIGGAPANFAYHMSQFGFDGCAVSAVGNDELGDELLRNFDEKQLHYLMEKVPYPTGTVQVELDSAGVPCYEIKENVAWDNIPFTSQLEELARNTRLVCFGSLAQRNLVSRQTINRFLDTMPDGEGQYKVFDINLRQHFYDKEAITASLGKCNILKLNEEELGIVSQMFDYPQDTLAARCMMLVKAFNLKMVILTCGEHGSFVFWRDNLFSFMPTPEVQVADTVGAGDSFTAAFCAALLKGKSIEEAHEFAAELSAFVCTQNGAMPELPQPLKEKMK